MTDERQPWDQQPEEPNLWYRRFERYLRLGPGRSFQECYNLEREETGKPPKKDQIAGAWKKAVDAWDWKRRAEQYDAHLSSQQNEEWQKRYGEFREREWNLVERLLNKVEQMLEFPLAKVEREQKALDNGNIVAVTNIYPMRWTMRDAASILDVAAKLIAARQNQKEDGEKPGPVINFDFNGIPAEVLRAIAYGGNQAGPGDGGAPDAGSPEPD